MIQVRGYSLKLEGRNVFWPVRMHRRLLDTFLDILRPRFEGAWLKEVLELVYVVFVFTMGYIGAQVVGNWALLLLLLYPLGMFTVIGGKTNLVGSMPVLSAQGAEIEPVDDVAGGEDDPFKRAVYLLTIQNGILYGLLMGVVVSVLVKDDGLQGEWIAIGLLALSLVLHLLLKLIPRRLT